MKKSLLLALALLFSATTFAQNSSFIINETFDSAEMPEGWYCTGEGTDNFKINTTNNAGGDPNELYFKSSPIVTAGINLVMGSADLTGVKELGLSFKHYLSNDSPLGCTIGIATSSDNGTTWNKAWSKTYADASSSGLYEINEIISTSDMGKTNVLFSLFFEGNTSRFNKWYFDNISIFTLSDKGADLQLSSIDVNNVIKSGDIEISFTADNISKEEITSFEASYEIEGHDIVTETFNTTIAPNQKQKVTFKKNVNLVPGTHEIKVNILSVNGEEDANTDNNSLSKEIRTFIKSIARTLMIEHFSSSTCQPCVSVDNDMTTLTENNEGKFTYVKYPWNYPGIGDKYYIKDCSVRGAYYGVDGVPSIIFDGTTTTKQPKQSNFDNSYANPAYIKIVGGYEIEDKHITVKATITPYIDIADVKVFMTVNEKTTTGNVGSNGLTEFHHVLMCMLTGSEGLDTSFYAGERQQYEFVYDMSTTNVEEMDDLDVAVWIHSYGTKEVHNSATLTEGFKEDNEDIDNITEEQISSVQVYPNPVNDKLYIATEEEVEDVVVYSITGVIVGQQSTVNGQHTLTIDLSDLKSGIYFVKINTEKGNIVKRIIKQ